MPTNKKSIFFEIILIVTVIFGFYFHTLNRPWIFYDERVLYEEAIVPVVNSLKEILEVISSFGVANNISSSNYLYTSISVDRINLFGAPFLLILGFLFKKSAFLYHIFNLFLHLANSCLVFIIIRRCFVSCNSFSRIISILLPLIWALHPTHVESIMLSTNVGATLSYFVFFSLFYEHLENRKNESLRRRFILPFCFLLTMLLNEYIVALPIILFFYSFSEEYKHSTFKNSVKSAFIETQSYTLGLFIYLIYHIFSGYHFSQSYLYNPIILNVERVFWLSPQIFMHFLKLVFFPATLSIDQTAHVKLGTSLFDIYSTFCIISLILWLLLPLFLLKKNKKSSTIWQLTWLFFLSLLPFSQIISATYCLIAERYFYTPVFFIVFGLALLINKYLSNAQRNKKLALVVCLTVILILLGIRTYKRTLDWKDDISLISSTIQTSPNSLYKGFRINTLAETILKVNPNDTPTVEKYFLEAQGYFYKALEELKEKNRVNNASPIILKSYGLDYASLITKNIYLICQEAFINPKKDYKTYLALFNPALKYFDIFDPRTLELYANLLIKTNQIAEAKKVFLYAHKKYPTSPFILVSLIRFELYTENSLPHVKEYVTKALKLYPYSKDILFEALRYYQIEGNLPEYSRYAYLYGLRAHSKFTYHEALTGYLALEDLENTKKTIDKLLKIDPQDPRTLYLTSSYYIKKQNYTEAISLLNQAYLNIKETKTDLQLAFDIVYTLANLYLAQGNSDKSKIFSGKALDFAKGNSQNLFKVKNFTEKTRN